MENLYMTYIRDKLRNNYDLHFRNLEMDFGFVYLAFINTICDEKLISKCIIEPMLATSITTGNIDVLKNDVITLSLVDDVKDVEDGLTQLLHGKVIVTFEFSDRAICCDVNQYAHRAVAIPPTEAVLKGSREGFTENLKVNISLVRKYLRDANLKCENMMVGEKSDTEIVIVYIQNVAPSALVKHIKKEIGQLNKGFILQNSHVSEQLATKQALFDTIGYTEKPDVFCAKIAEGRVGVIMSGDPAAITAPCFLIEMFQAATSYAAIKHIGNFVIFIRWIAFTIAMLMPGLYIALASHHFGLIPRLLAFRIAVSRAGVPYPIVIEFLILAIFFQVLREGGLRLPQPIGQAISIVGALILGDAAVNSGLASNVTVLVVALSSISSFLLPAISEAIVIWSFILVICSALLGLPGYFVGFVMFCSHLAGLTSCGYPYMYPFGTLKHFKFKDLLWRGDLNEMSNNIFKEDQKND
ncbi:MAG: spore germination protein [Vallitaleaceae bacterium]|nr:spore germination protein [Vallitaleaceae bacterium]